MASLAALREARAALEQCLSALDGVESEIEVEAVKGGEAEELRSALRSAVADAAATVVSLEDETGEWEEGNEGTCPPPWAPGAPRLDFGALAARHPRLAPFLVARQMRRRKRKKRKKEEEEQGAEEEEEEEEEEEVKAITSTTTLDFSSHDACAALTAALLLEGCGVRGWSVPRGSLVPPLGVRDEYLSYVSKLISSASSFSSSSRRRRRRPRILDVGCGSNLVFCLLASSSSSGGRRWRSVGLDASPAALADAQKILERNPQLSPLVELRMGPEEGLVDAERVGILRHGFKLKRKKAKENGGGGGLGAKGGKGDEKSNDDDDNNGEMPPPPPQNSNDLNSDLDPLDLDDDDEWFDATVCNPPFFSSAAERAATASSFAAGAWGGTDAEVVCAAGGEAAFVSKMIRESCERDFEIGRRVGWFTVFLGKKATLRSMVALLRGENESAGRGIGGKEGDEGGEGAAATATATATSSNPPLLQPLETSRRPALRWRALDEHGGRTTRWVLAWSWTQQQ